MYNIMRVQIGAVWQIRFRFLDFLVAFSVFDPVGWAAGRASGLQKNEWWGAGVVVCLEQGADLYMAQLMPLPLTVSCFSKIQIGFTFLVPAHLGSPGKGAFERVCVLDFYRLVSHKYQYNTFQMKRSLFLVSSRLQEMQYVSSSEVRV